MVNCQKYLDFITENSSSRTQKNSPTRLVKVNALMVGGMFTVATMSCWGERFIEVRIRSRLLAIVP